ncbi:glycerophosphoryl diester phosphodiesterase [Lentibacillus kapialis]|uniref:Glycerophosphoryl diester phosphodiesterase n=1 Tax=Lentibacillus kapialis TaxID=340214 RepID=A0A917UY62_9BACI|nr:glycerophosphodiester phosphodiesterase family protein [Lentibacillus kapialis]GGJ94455.1 glycerophosphoryl diester phosphodiesterase [Lentibacillus kapialis]
MSTKIFAHRGASKQAPENTMAAFTLAYQHGADGIETDVHLTRDHIPVLIHDEHVKRTTSSTGYIKDFTYRQLQKLDAGSWFSSEFAGLRIIPLDEFLEWIYDKPLYLNIELKNNKIDYNDLESIVYDRILHYDLLHRTILSTFNPRSLNKLNYLNRDINTALLTTKRGKNLVSAAQELGANAVHIKYRLLNQFLVDKCHHEAMGVRVYTVNRPRQMLRCFAVGCDAIFTDVPDRAIRFRNQFTNQ